MPYTPNQLHRNPSYANKKSQWTINLQEEENCYHVASSRNWQHANSLWGLNIQIQGNPPIRPLGLSPSPNCSILHIAKFVSDAIGNWHGYPVAYWLSPFDKPSQNILSDWENHGLISRPQKAKIYRGKQCNL
ncbi:hypothetical protein [Chromobacterium amazonense]|uniref:hypothetical protein n=1 Tax=Chromobacterium amazonense TaxID=1382803 RepID=UPI00111363D1|nr:hypothetical protein [Chromobacterium amazonense]